MDKFWYLFSLFSVVLFVAIANGLLYQMNSNPTVESFSVRKVLENMMHYDNVSSVYKEQYNLIDKFVPAEVEYKCQRTLQDNSQYKVISSLINSEKQWYHSQYKFSIKLLYEIYKG